MRFSTQDIEAALQPLVGLRVAQLYHAASMKGFLFRQCDSPLEQATDWCLHISCTWRLENGAGIVTGSYDWTEHASRKDLLADEWDPAKGESLQEKILRALLNDIPGEDRTIRNRTNLLVVKEVMGDQFGGFLLVFDDDYRLAVFPSTTRGEMWRIFADSPDAPHFVMEV